VASLANVQSCVTIRPIH